MNHINFPGSTSNCCQNCFTTLRLQTSSTIDRSFMNSENPQPSGGTIQPLRSCANQGQLADMRPRPRSVGDIRHPPPFHPMVEAHQHILLRHLPHVGTSSASALPPRGRSNQKKTPVVNVWEVDVAIPWSAMSKI